MTRKEFLMKLESVLVNDEVVQSVEGIYGHTLSMVIKQILSISEESIFFDDGWRTLSFAEILDAQADLHVDFKTLGFVPVIDCGDNDFVVFHMEDDTWSKYNIVDGTVFMKKAQLEDLFGYK